MLMLEEREKIVEYGRKMLDQGLTKGTGGNLSIYNRDLELMAISPSGKDYFKTEVEDIVIMDLRGRIVEGENKPSSEYEMHSILYRNREDIDAVVHTHSVYATSLSSLRLKLPAVSYLVALAGKEVRCANYASFGTRELAENAFLAMDRNKAVLLANHGLLAGSYSIEDAFNIAEEIEFCCEIYIKARSIGEPVLIDDEEMENLLRRFNTYGHIK